MSNNPLQQNFNADPDITTITSAEVADTITVRDDGQLATDKYVNEMSDMPRGLYVDCIDPSPHSLNDFLTRYVILKQGLWDQSAAIGSVLAKFDFPRALFNNGTYEVVQNTRKLDGFVGLKAKVRVRFEVNSEVAQAGSVTMRYIPYSEYMTSHTEWFSSATAANAIPLTGCAGTMMSIPNNESMEFVTPYVSPYLYFNLVTGQGSFGSIYVFVMSPVSSAASSTSVPYTLWARFEDVELVYPTDAPLTTVYAQSGREKVYAQAGNEAQVYEQKRSISTTVGSLGGAIADTLPWVGLGWLSSPVRFLSDTSAKVLKMLGFSKPSVEAPTTRMKQTPASYFLNGDGCDTSHKLGLSATNALSTFSGWAGTDEDEMRLDYVASRPAYFTKFTWTTSSSADDRLWSQPVNPLASSNFLARTTNAYARPVFLTPCAKVASMFNFWRGTMVFRFHFVKTQMHSGRVRISFKPYSYDVSTTRLNDMPGYTYTEDVDVTTGSDFTFRVPFASVRPWMNVWYDPDTTITSGDARNYATGLVEVTALTPLRALSNAATSIEVLVFAHMEDAQFAGPIVSPILPYNIPNTAQSTSSVAAIAVSSTSNALRRNRRVDDISGSGSSNVGSTPIPSVLVSPTNLVSDDVVDGGYAQSGRARLIKTCETTEAINKRDLSLMPYSSCIGEVVSSYRQYLKRFSSIGVVRLNAIPSTGTSLGSTGNGFVLFPWAPVMPQNGTFTVTAAGAMTPQFSNIYQLTANAFIKENCDLYSMLYPMYAFFRGSIRYKLVIRSAGANFNPTTPVYVYINNFTQPGNQRARPFMQQTVYPTGQTPQVNLGTGPIQPLYDQPATTVGTLKTSFAYQPGFVEPTMVVYPDKEGVIEFEVPYHATGHMTPTYYGVSDIDKARSIFFPTPTVTITGGLAPATNPSLLNSLIEVYRAVGDDFSFGGLLGVPQHAYWQSNTDPT